MAQSSREFWPIGLPSQNWRLTEQTSARTSTYWYSAAVNGTVTVSSTSPAAFGTIEPFDKTVHFAIR